MSTKMYVSDPEVWRKFYRNMLNGKFDPYRYGGRQKGGGGGFGGALKRRRSYMIPVNANAKDDDDNEEKVVVGQIVSPVAGALERANSRLKDQIKRGEPHVPVMEKDEPSVMSDKRIPPPPGIPDYDADDEDEDVLFQVGRGKRKRNDRGSRSAKRRRNDWERYCLHQPF